MHGNGLARWVVRMTGFIGFRKNEIIRVMVKKATSSGHEERNGFEWLNKYVVNGLDGS